MKLKVIYPTRYILSANFFLFFLKKSVGKNLLNYKTCSDSSLYFSTSALTIIWRQLDFRFGFRALAISSPSKEPSYLELITFPLVLSTPSIHLTHHPELHNFHLQRAKDYRKKLLRFTNCFTVRIKSLKQICVNI